MPAEWIALVGPLLALASRVMEAAVTSLRYRKKCRLLTQRVELISQHLGALQQSQWTHNPPETARTLECLEEALLHAEGLVGSCQRKRKALDFFKAFKNRGDFSFVNKRIDHIMETFHMANHTLLMLSLYGDRIFMTVLETLLQDGACRRLTQDKKAKLERAMNNYFPNDNMPPEKKEVIGLIKRELAAQGSGNGQWNNANNDGSSTSNDRSRDQNEHVTTEVTYLAREIMKEAQAVNHHNRDEVERVSSLAQQVASLLPHLQSAQLTRHQEDWRKLLHDLQDELHAALQDIKRSTRNNGGYSCGAPPLVSTRFFRQQGKQMTEHGNKIEQHYQRLTFLVIRHIIANQ